MVHRMAQGERQIRTMVRRIVERFDPDQVILFGSRARGDAGPESDVDLLVVMPMAGSKREKQIEIQVALHDIPGAVDVMVTTPDALERRRDIPGTIERLAFLDGRVLYARRARTARGRAAVGHEGGA